MATKNKKPGIDLTVPLRYDRTTPLNQQVADYLRTLITDGDLPRGATLPPSRRLAETMGLSRETIERAYKELTAQGLIAAKGRQATVVTLERKSAARTPRKALTPVRMAAPAARYGTVTTNPEYTDRPFVAFRPSLPPVDIFPAGVWERIARHTVQKISKRELIYGDPLGDAKLRGLIARKVAPARGIRCSSEQVVITSSSKASFVLLAELLVDDGDTVVVEEPGFRTARELFTWGGAQVVGAAVDDEGLTLGHLAGPPIAKIAYVTPSYQFPTGRMLSLRRRLQLLSWAHRSGGWIVEDDYDFEYHYEGRLLPALFALDEGANTIYMGTFSKSVFPGIGISYVIRPERLLAAARQVQATLTRAPSIVSQLTLARFIDSGEFFKHTDRVREVCRKRRDVLLEELARQCSRWVETRPCAFGMHLVATVRANCPARELSRAMRKRGLLLPSLGDYMDHSYQGSEFVFGFSSFLPGALKTGVTELRKELEGR